MGRRKTSYITETQKRTLWEIWLYIEQTGRSPTFRELASKRSLSHEAIAWHIKQLVRKGYINREHGAHRGIRIVAQEEYGNERVKERR